MSTARDMAAEVVPVDVSVMPTHSLTASVREAIIVMGARAFDQDFGNLFTFVTDSLQLLRYRGAILIGHACWATRPIHRQDIPRCTPRMLMPLRPIRRIRNAAPGARSWSD